MGRYHDVEDNGVLHRIPLWLGVPAACQLVDEEGLWLYVYYTAELTTHANATQFDGAPKSAQDPAPDPARVPSSFVPGTFCKRFNMARLQFHSGARHVYDRFWMPVSTDETTWNSNTEYGEVYGEDLGKVNIWVAEGREWRPREAPDGAAGNRLIWEVYANLKDVDAVPAVFEGGVALYFAATTTGTLHPRTATTRTQGATRTRRTTPTSLTASIRTAMARTEFL